MELPDFSEEGEGVNMRKKILAKCIGESLNRYVASVLKDTILSKEQTISKAPMLLQSSSIVYCLSFSPFACSFTSSASGKSML